MRNPFFILLSIAFTITQLVAGYQGINAKLGPIGVAVALFLALQFRFFLPITIGAFIGATQVWGWHWIPALLFVAPGLILLIPGALMSFLQRPSKPSKPKEVEVIEMPHIAANSATRERSMDELIRRMKSDS